MSCRRFKKDDTCEFKHDDSDNQNESNKVQYILKEYLIKIDDLNKEIDTLRKHIEMKNVHLKNLNGEKVKNADKRKLY